MPEVVRVLLADSYTTTFTALKAWLQPTPFMLLPQAAQTVDEAIALTQRGRPHILLIAQHLLPRSPSVLLDGLWGAPEAPLAERNPKLILLAGALNDDDDDDDDDDEQLCQWWQAGLVGYLPRRASQQVWLQCMQVVGDGSCYFPQAILGRLQDVVRRQVENESMVLSEREQKLLVCLTNELTNKEIATRLNLSNQTVRNNLSHLYRKLGVADRDEAAGWDGV